MVVVSALIIFVANYFRPSFAESTEQREDEEIKAIYDLTLWYYDEDLTDYVESVAEEYFKRTGLKVGYQLVSAVGLFERINSENINSGEGPDLYITESTRLEQAYLGAVAKVNEYGDIYNSNEFCDTAINAVTCNGKLVAYPLCFNTSFFAYNTEYFEKKPTSFEDIAVLSENFSKETDSVVDMVFLFDPSDLITNFGYIGAYTAMGGAAGDDAKQISLDSTELSSALTFYSNLSKRISIPMSTTTQDLVMNSFCYGRTEAAILQTSDIDDINSSNINFRIIVNLPLNSELSSKALSTTLCVGVNPMSDDVSEAENLAKYMTYERVDSIYEKTGYMACRRIDYTLKGFSAVYSQYESSVSLPKIIETEELWKDFKYMLNNVWNGSDPDESLSVLRNSLNSALSTRNLQKNN